MVWTGAINIALILSGAVANSYGANISLFQITNKSIFLNLIVFVILLIKKLKEGKK